MPWAFNDAELAALGLSVRVSLASTAIAVVPGIAIAWLLARRDFFARRALEIVVHLPLVLPPVVVGYLLLALLGRRAPVGAWLHSALGLDLAFTWKGAALAAAVMGFPLLVRTARLSIEAIDPRMEQAARTLGATPARIFWTLTLPLAMPGVIAGIVLAFARSIGEFGATITFAGNIEGQSRTLPVAIYTSAQVPGGDGAALRMVILSVGVSAAAMVVAEVFAARLTPRRSARPC